MRVFVRKAPDDAGALSRSFRHLHLPKGSIFN
jgi:hypothetical protein